MNEKGMLAFMDSTNGAIQKLNGSITTLNETLTAYRHKNDKALLFAKEEITKLRSRVETLQSQVAILKLKKEDG